MTQVVSQRELRNDNGPILRAVVEQGETFIVTRNGVPSAELRPLQEKPHFVSRSALAAGKEYASKRQGRFEELRNDLEEVLDLEID